MAAERFFIVPNFNVQTRIATVETIYHRSKNLIFTTSAKITSQINTPNDNYQLNTISWKDFILKLYCLESYIFFGILKNNIPTAMGNKQLNKAKQI